MLPLPYILGLLVDRKLSVVAERTGIPHATIWAIATGQSRDPLYSNIKALSDYFIAQHAHLNNVLIGELPHA